MMRWLLFLLAAALTGFACVDAKDSVISITSEDADSRLTSGSWLVEFYAEWCGFCKRLEPTYADVAEELTPKGVMVAKIDGTKNQALSARFGVQGFPSIFHIQDGEVRSYDDSRTKEALIGFALGGWKNQPASFSSLTHPLGIPMRSMGMLVEVAVVLQTLYEHMRATYGLSAPVAIGIALVATVLTGTGLGFILSLFFPHPAARTAARPHRD